MKICPNSECPDVVDCGIVGEYIDEIETCPKCGARLISVEGPDALNRASHPSEEFELVVKIDKWPELLVAKSLLDNAGIPFFTRNERGQDLFGLGQIGLGFNAIIGPVELWVSSLLAADARELLEPVRDGSGADPGLPDSPSEEGETQRN